MRKPDESHLSHFALHIDGKPAPPDVMRDFLDCTVENSLHLPDVCALRMHDAGFKWLDARTFREGTRIEVFGGEEGSTELQPLFNGEVTALEMDLPARGSVPTLVVRCFDRSHRLHRGRYSRSFVQMTDSDIVKKVGSEAEFSVHADGTPQVHDWVFQNNQTNWEFLTERAARNGYRLYVQGERDLHFHKVEDRGRDAVTLEWGKNLRAFHPRIAASHQVDEVVVRGWDTKTKQPIIGRCARPTGLPQVGESTPGGEVARTAYGAARMVVADRPVHSQREADDLARSICDDIGGAFLEAECVCYAQPNLRPGMMVKTENIGKRFSGEYQVTAATHVYTPAEGYTTRFSVSGKQPSSLLSLLQGDGRGKRAPLGGSIVVGVVTDNRDPENLGRVKVQYPWLTEEHTSYWARQAAPMAGPGRGFFCLPEVDDEVLVAFEHGDISRPHIIGALWNGKDRCVERNDEAVSGGKVNHRIFKTRVGHTLLLDDTDGKGEMSLMTKDGRQVVLDDKNNRITVTDKAGNRITIKTDNNSIAIDCQGDFSVNAKGNVSIVGAQGVTVQGATVKIN